MNEFQFPESRPQTKYEGDHDKPQHNKIAAIKLFREATGAELAKSVYSFEASFGQGSGIMVSNAQIGRWIKAYYAHLATLAKQEPTPEPKLKPAKEPEAHEEWRLRRRAWLDHLFDIWKSDTEELVHFDGHAELTTSSLSWWMAEFGKHGFDPTYARIAGGDWVLIIRYMDIKDENL